MAVENSTCIDVFPIYKACICRVFSTAFARFDFRSASLTTIWRWRYDNMTTTMMMKRMSGSIVDHEKKQKKRTADCTHSNPRSISTFMLDTLTAALLPSPVKWFMDYQEWAEHWWTNAIRSSPVGYVQPIDLKLLISTTQSILHWVLVFSGCPI